MELNAFLAYCLAAVAIIIVPGPTVTMIVANSLRHGSRAGMLNVAGTQAGLLIWLAIAVLGLAAAIQAMGVWFDVVRIAGAAYLVWLGIGLWRSGGELRTAERARPNGSFFLQGLWVILSNPKMLLVFGALIPQFISPERDFAGPADLPGRGVHGAGGVLRRRLCAARRIGRGLAVARPDQAGRADFRQLPDRRRAVACLPPLDVLKGAP